MQILKKIGKVPSCTASLKRLFFIHCRFIYLFDNHKNQRFITASRFVHCCDKTLVFCLIKKICVVWYYDIFLSHIKKPAFYHMHHSRFIIKNNHFITKTQAFYQRKQLFYQRQNSRFNSIFSRQKTAVLTKLDNN